MKKCEVNFKIMKAVAVISEYNPFHNGHVCLLREIKKAFPEHIIISVMSGSTVQRGDFAVQSKYVRAENALKNGSDLVFELPFPFSVSAAEQFASAGVYIAHSLNAEVLAFGSESGNLDALKKAAKLIDSEDFEKVLKTEVENNQKESFIAIKERVYESLCGEKLFDTGNDILAIEYLKNTEKYKDITPYVIHRTAPFSATSARKAIFSGDSSALESLLPTENTEGEIHGGLKGLSQLVLGHLRLSEARDTGNGIRNAIKQAAEKAEDYESFINVLPTKNYTLARLRREIIAMLFDVTESEKNVTPEYTVLLGASEKGLKYLSEKKKEITLPVLTKKADAKLLSDEGKKQLAKAELADSIYALGLKKETGAYFKTPVIYR